MKFFIDTANLAEIREAHDMGILDGVTTNPSLMAKEGISGTDNILKHYKAICGIVDGDVSAEVISTDFAGMVREGELLAEIDPKIVVKVPMIKDGVKAIRYFSDRGIKTNCTLVFSAGQALLAAKGVDFGGASQTGKGGRKLSFSTKIQFNGNLMVGKAYTGMLELKPGDEFEIKLGRKQIRLVPIGSEDEEE